MPLNLNKHHLLAVWTGAAAIAIGIKLNLNGSGSVASAAYWSMLTALVLLWPLDEGLWRTTQRYCRNGLASAWLWLAIAALLSNLVLYLGENQYGALRHYGSAQPLRAGLWALAAFIVFLALFAQRPAPGIWQHLLAALGSGLVVLGLSLQPDLHSLAVLASVSLVMALSARNAMRWWLPAAVIGGSALLTAYLAMSPFRLARIARYANTGTDSPSGTGMESMLSADALTPGDWLGSTIGLLLGAAMLLTFGFSLWRLGQQCKNPALQAILRGGLLAHALAAGWAFIADIKGWIPNDASFGLPFLAAGQSSLAAALLLTVAVAGAERTNR